MNTAYLTAQPCASPTFSGKKDKKPTTAWYKISVPESKKHDLFTGALGNPAYEQMSYDKKEGIFRILVQVSSIGTQLLSNLAKLAGSPALPERFDSSYNEPTDN